MKCASLYLAALLLVITLIGTGQEEQKQPQVVPAPVLLPPWVLHSRVKQADVPEYPKEAREHHIEGDVTIDLIVDANGNVASAKWIDDGTSTSLSDATMAAVRKWEYQPTILDEKPAAVTSWVVIRFQLSKEPNVEILTRAESSTPARKAEPLKGPFKIRISSGVAESLIIHKVDPSYPYDAKVANIQGDVIFRVIIDQQGNVSQITLVSGHPLLAEAAKKAVRQWKYRPFQLNGQPVEADAPVTIRFHM